MRRVVVALVVVLAACSSSAPGGGDGGGGGTVDLASAGPPDLLPRSTSGIACGAIACTQMAQFCCTGDSGATGTCQQTQNPMCGLAEFQCDGPEDCAPAEHECCVEGGLAACRTPGYCVQRATMTQASLMCHSNNDCPTGQQCIAAPNGSPYALCITPH